MLPEMPVDTNRLTANRMLRVRKVLQYLAEKSNLTLDSACIGSNDCIKGMFIDLYCGGKMVRWTQTLASIKYVICKGGGPDLVFHYLERS